MNRTQSHNWIYIFVISDFRYREKRTNKEKIKTNPEKNIEQENL
jgi:hypothetical protein